jgi:multidrug efflux system outer membrane protein
MSPSLHSIAATAALFALSLGCAVGPNYKRPVVKSPADFRRPTQAQAEPSKESLADLQWASLFGDEVLTNLVKTALAQSYDLQAASQRVLEARANLGITRSQLFPRIDASGNFSANRTSSIGSFNFIPAGSTGAGCGGSLNRHVRNSWLRRRRGMPSCRA